MLLIHSDHKSAFKILNTSKKRMILKTKEKRMEYEIEGTMEVTLRFLVVPGKENHQRVKRQSSTSAGIAWIHFSAGDLDERPENSHRTAAAVRGW